MALWKQVTGRAEKLFADPSLGVAIDKDQEILGASLPQPQARGGQLTPA